MEIKKLCLRPAGMFSNVNEVVQQVHLANKHNYQFEISWENSCYRDENYRSDPWLYYFKPCFNVKAENDADILPGGVEVACTVDNIITPREVDGQCNPLLLPIDREYASTIIKKHILPSKAIISLIDEFSTRFFTKCTIGVHLRGGGRTDGGALEARQKLKLRGGIPFEVFFHAIDKKLSEEPTSTLFLCSDSQKVVDGFTDRYGDALVLYPSIRSDFGEMHANHSENKGIQFPRKKLGIDVVAEAHLLSKCDYFIHGNSNVANFVLCCNPSLEHQYIFA